MSIEIVDLLMKNGDFSNQFFVCLPEDQRVYRWG